MKIAPIFLQYDYGDKNRGDSLEKNYFLPALESFATVCPFWIEDHPPNVLQDHILAFAEEHKPDYIFTILVQNEIAIETLDKLKENGHKVVNWFCDDQWRKEWSLDIAKHLHCSITTDKYALKMYKDRDLPVVKSQWGVSEPVKKLTKDYAYDLTFVGMRNPVREWFVSELSKDFEVKCFGHGWQGGKVLHPRHIIEKSKINLNLSNSIQNDVRFCAFINGRPDGQKFNEQIKARHFEIPAWGGFQLSHYALEVEDYLHIGKEIAVYGNLDDMKKQIDYYLWNDKERERIKRNGWKRAKRMTYNKRLKEAFREIRYIKCKPTASK